MAAQLSLTETPNELTGNLGGSSPIEIVRLLRQVDAQVFAGWQHYPGLLDTECLEAMAAVANVAAEIIAAPSPESIIVLSGCGTSGRMGFVVARAFNEILKASGKQSRFRYLCAGGDPALFTSYEAPEDNVAAGRDGLAALAKDKKQVLYIGITCGLSAPYVAAQLDYANDHPNITPVLLGFNPLERARVVPIEGWTKNFAKVVSELTSNPRFTSIVPVVGPEGLTGSTRMKGGTATKIILETIFAEALQSNNSYPISTINIESILHEYAAAVQQTYSSAESIASMLEMAGNSLRSSGRLLYMGFSSYGVAALIDASECPPTYNAGWEEVRAYLHGGYKSLRNFEGDLSDRGNQYQLELNSFDETVSKTLTSNDSIVFVVGTTSVNVSEIVPRASEAQKRGAKIGLIWVRYSADSSPDDLFAQVSWDSVVCVRMPQFSLSSMKTAVKSATGEGCFLAEIAIKLVLNALTTGGHIIKGKILSNRMVDLQVSNNKLFYRSITIVSNFSGKDEIVSRHALLRALHRTDIVTEFIENLDISAHIKASADAIAQSVRVVPSAILLAANPELSFEKVQSLLESQPQLNKSLFTIFHGETKISS